jgi:hypothetical protein
VFECVVAGDASVGGKALDQLYLTASMWIGGAGYAEAIAEREFRQLQGLRAKFPFDFAVSQRYYKIKNRYKDIMAHEPTRVVLPPTADNEDGCVASNHTFQYPSPMQALITCKHSSRL